MVIARLIGHNTGMKSNQPGDQAIVQITIPLDIPDVRVLGVETNEGGDVVITVESTLEGTRCGKCGQIITKFHGHDEPITLRHLPILGRRTYLRLRPKRYRCLNCENEPTTTQKLEWYTPKSPNTRVYERHLLLQLVNSTIEDVSLKEDVGYKEIEALLGRWIENRLDWRVLKKIRLLGLDEIALRKGHRDFVVLVTARMADGEVKIVAVLPDRTKATVRKFLESIPKRIKRVIRTVCTDLYEGYINAVKEVLSQAMIVADRFHIAKLYRDCADQLRKKEQRRLKKELPKEEYQKLKGAMWAFRKKKSDLEAEEEKVLNLLFEDSPELKKAYNYREQLSEIFEEDLTKEEAQKKIRNWSRRVKAAGVKCFDGFIETLWKWREEITNYFVNRDNSGFVEGFNNKVKVLKRRCYGIFNLTHLFQRIYLDVEGYRQFARTN